LSRPANSTLRGEKKKFREKEKSEKKEGGASVVKFNTEVD